MNADQFNAGFAKPPLVLIVENESAVQKLLGRMLEKFGCRTRVFDCGDELLAAPRQLLMTAVCAFVDDAFPGNLTRLPLSNGAESTSRVSTQPFAKPRHRVSHRRQSRHLPSVVGSQ